MSADVQRVVEEHVDLWRRRLIDMSYRNRLIKYRPTRASTIEIELPSLDALLADPSRSAPWKFYFPPEPEEPDDEAREEAAAFVDEVVVQSAQHPERPPQSDEIVVRGEINPRRINRLLENLARKSNAEFQDKALRILHIAAGFLDWVDPARDEMLSSPLILVPVELRRESARHPYALYFVDDEEIVVNPSLTEKLRRDVKLDMPGEWAWEDKPISDELDEIEEAVANTDWTIRRDAVIGLFSFQKFVMYRDLLDNESLVTEHPVVRSLARKQLDEELVAASPEIPMIEELDDIQLPHDDFAILDADGTQRLCLEAARRGESFVMQGPPGTGKSQTIANVIADSVARGRRVLFVSEKAAALDVVHKRLAAQGLDEFCLLLHGEHAARREVVQTLARSLKDQPVPRLGMTSHELERLKQLREVLNSTAQLVHLPLPRLAGRTLWEVLGELAQLHASPSVPAAPPASDATGAGVRTEFQQIDEVFQRLAERWAVSARSFAWAEYGADRFSGDERGRVLDVVRLLRHGTRVLTETAADTARLLGWPVPISLRAVDHLVQLGSLVERAPPVEKHWLAPTFSHTLEGTAAVARDTYAAHGSGVAALERAYVSKSSDDFRVDPAEDLKARLRDLSAVGGRTAEWESQLVTSLAPSRAFLARLPELINAVEASGSESARILGQPLSPLTLERARDLAELATIAFSADMRPDRAWLVKAGLDRARAALSEIRETFEEYQSERHRLFAEYVAEALDADIAGLLHRFRTEHVGFFAKLRSAYRRDAREAKALRQDRKIPKELTADLESLVRLQMLGRTLDEKSSELAVAFGAYYEGRDTDVGKIGRACETAAELLKRAAAESDLSALAAQAAIGSMSDPSVGQLADRLDAALDEIAAGVAALRPVIGRSVGLFERVAMDTLRENVVALTDAFDAVDDVVADLLDENREPVETLAELTGRAELITTLHRNERAIAENEEHWREALGSYFREANTDWARIAIAAAWLAEFEQFVGSSVPPAVEARLLEPEPRWPDFVGLAHAREALAESAAAVFDLFESERREVLVAEFDQTDFDAVSDLTHELEQHIDDLFDWTEFRAWRRRARELEWGDFLEALIDHDVDQGATVPAFRRAYWNRRLEAVFEEDPSLEDRGSTYARWIEEFRDLDRKLVRTASDRVIAARTRSRPALVDYPGSQVALLRREAAKKRRHLPVRKLLAALPTLLSELKPCLMMSPLTVSHFLAPQHDFDLVIFDEASQVPPQDAINCIYRGKQLIVAGDSRQLPPTPFFQVAEVDEPLSEDGEEEVAEDMESILDSCEALLPQHPLQWHYRSRHEHLIAFSNAHVYDSSLLTFPSADARSASKGVRFIHVPDGVYERGRSSTNRREAQVVAEQVMHHLLAGRTSVGVIAFNTQQANAIDEELERLRIQHPELEEHFAGDRLDAVFVKHLESVQGDERDVIVFSVGYGRDPTGKFTMNFGPLNREGGYRRLNVAVTRARELIELVSSVHAADFTLSESSSRGSRLLREYVRYAETSGASLPGGDDPATRTFDSPLEAAIGEELIELGYEPVSKVGVGSFRVDVGVHASDDPDTYVLGIETDGPTYSSAPTARDRDRLRDDVLTNLKWRVHRIWALDWVRNRQSEIDRLEVALGAAPRSTDQKSGADVQDVPVERERAERAVQELRESIDSARLPWVVEYERHNLQAQSSSYDFHVSINRERQRDLVIELATFEAPIYVDYVIRRLVRAWGVGRTSDRIRAAAKEAISMAERKGAIELRGDFIWRPDQELEHVRSPCWDDDRTFRGVEEIPPEEIDLAFVKLMREGGTTDAAHLIPAVARILGFDRVGANVRDVLESRLANVVGSSRS